MIFRSLRTGVMAGAVCPPEVMKKSRKPNEHERSDYFADGMTETSPVSTQTKIETLLLKNKFIR